VIRRGKKGDYTCHGKTNRQFCVSVASITKRSWTRRFGLRIPVGWQYFSVMLECSERLWGTLCLLFSGYRVSVSRVRRPGSEVNHSPPCGAEVKNAWICTSSSPIYLYALNRAIFVCFYTLAAHPSGKNRL